MTDIADKARKVVALQTGQPEGAVHDAAKLSDLGVDSLGQVELYMALEEALGVDIPDDAADEIVTFGDLVAALHRHSGLRVIK